VAAFAAGCGDGGAGADGGADALVPECPVETDEDCDACYAHVGDCCKPGDLSWIEAAPTLARACSANPLCAACCNECAAMSCDELLENDLCPAQTAE
jgi:hypothetical protein